MSITTIRATHAAFCYQPSISTILVVASFYSDIVTLLLGLISMQLIVAPAARGTTMLRKRLY